MAKVGSVAINLTARTSAFVKGMRKAQTSVNRFAKVAARAAQRVIKFGLVLGTAAATGLALVVRRAFQSADALAKTSQKLGIATEDLAAFRLAAELSGVAARTFDMGLQRMTRRIAEAAKGTGEAKAALKELDLDSVALAAAGPAVAFKAVSEAMQQVKTQADRVRLSFKLFDSEGVALVNTTTIVARNFAEVEARAKALGLSLSKIDTSKIERANDAVLQLKGAFTGASNIIAVRLAPLVTKITKQFVEWAIAGGGVTEKLGLLIARVTEVGRVFLTATAAFVAFRVAMKVTAAFTAFITIVEGVIVSLKALRGAQKATAVGSAILSAIVGGPAGLIKVAAGIAAAGVAAAGVSIAFDAMETRARNAMAAANDAADAIKGVGDAAAGTVAARLARADARAKERTAEMNARISKRIARDRAANEARELKRNDDRFTRSRQLLVGLENSQEQLNRRLAEASFLLRTGALSADEYSTAVMRIRDSFEGALDPGKGLLNQLQMQIDTFGLASRAARIFALEQAGAARQTIANLKARDRTLTNLEKSERDRAKIRTGLGSRQPIQLASAIEAGSAAAFRASFTAEVRNRTQKQLEGNTRKTADNTKATVRELERNTRAIEDRSIQIVGIGP